MLRLAITTIAVTALLPATASAAVTATSQVSSNGTSLTVRGDGADDTIDVTCADGDAKVNGLDPVSDADTQVPAPCVDITAIAVDGGPGNDEIRLSGVGREDGFTNQDLCAPCFGGFYSIVVECVDGSGDDSIRSSPIGSLIGGCSGMRSMSGNDTVNTSGGADSIAAGPGSDHIHSGPGDDQAFGGPGDDIVRTGGGTDILAGKQGDDLLAAGGGSDRLAGGPGDDLLRGGAGDDACVGGPGGGTARDCEYTRGVSRPASLGFAPRF
jgi:Ca2+-binding RTX toxin-like protein